MTIWGLIIGGVTGFAFGGPIGALLGAAAGHWLASNCITGILTRMKPSGVHRGGHRPVSKNGQSRWRGHLS